MSEVNVQIQNPKQTVNINNPVITIEMPTDSISVEIVEGQPIEIQVQNPVIEVNIGGPCDCSGGGHEIQDEGTPLAQRAKLNFIGPGVTATDNPGQGATDVIIPGGGGGTWGSITGTLSDQTDLQTALDGKSDTGHTHALSDITQSGATTNQVPKWDGSAWVPANEAGGADGNGIYSGSGTIPGATEATLEESGSIIFKYFNGIPSFSAYDSTGNTSIQSSDSDTSIVAATGEARILAPAVYIEPGGVPGTNGQVLTSDGSGYATWQNASGGGASVTEITSADMQTAITNGTLTPGAWYLITDATGTDLGFLTNAVNENTINVSGVGGYLNADFQAVGDYSGTPETFNAQLGIWRTGFETVTINYLNLTGGTFAVGDTITGGTTGATAVIVTDDGAASMTAYMTSAGVAFDGSEVLDNGGGVTADQDGPAGSPTIVQGDVVIWNLTHYQLTDATLLDGNNPATNTAAYTVLAKGDYPETYVTAWDVSEFDFPNAWLQYRQDLRGNKVSFSNITDNVIGATGVTRVIDFQFGRDDCYDNIIVDAAISMKNFIPQFYGNVFGLASAFKDTNVGQYESAVFSRNEIAAFCEVENVTFGQSSEMASNKMAPSSYINGIVLGSSVSFREADIRQNGTIADCNFGFQTIFASNIVFNSGTISEIITGADTVIANNILENGASLTDITAGANCSISRNKIGQGATLGGSTTMGDGAEMNDNVLANSREITSITLAASSSIQNNDKLEVNTVTLGQFASISNTNGPSVILNLTMGESAFISGGENINIEDSEIGDNAGLQNVSMNGGYFSVVTIPADVTISQVLIDNIGIIEAGIEDSFSFKSTSIGFSDIPGTIDITGLTTLDCTAAWAQYRGIYNLTSSNATENIDTITNPPTLFPFTLRPAAGLVLTITGTAYAGIGAGQIALKNASYTLDGDKGEYIVLEIDPLGTGALIEKQVVNGLI